MSRNESLDVETAREERPPFNGTYLRSVRMRIESLFRPSSETVEQASTPRGLIDPLLSGQPSTASLSEATSGHLESEASGPAASDHDDIIWQSLLNIRHRLLTDERRRYLRELIRRSGNYLAYTTLLIMLMVLPKVIYQGIKSGHIDFAAYNSAGVMVLGTIVLSFRLVYLHLTHWYMPEVQKYVVRILWMVPLYAVQSWLSLRFHSSRIYIDTIRDFYEAYGMLERTAESICSLITCIGSPKFHYLVSCLHDSHCQLCVLFD
jgi:hypothetical protein